MSISIIFLIAIGFFGALNAQTCPANSFYDPSCAQGGVGCNAGGQSSCRYCG